ncbi:MAG: anhydro-N-acetylmuramic acid kinase [Clostridia bacterium]|nr:anhydro-N-acetylmuramic acid kinase [Clostridia bacterium]
MTRIERLLPKKTLRVIGLMSGTSADGIDAALTEITGYGLNTCLKMLAFVTLPYPEEIRRLILSLATGGEGGSRKLCLFNALMGELSLRACLAVCEVASVRPEEIDLVGSHGQTLYHQPTAVEFAGYQVRGTLQLGEASVIAEGLGCPVVSDFRVRDVAAGGQGAPLVPYTEYLLYRQKDRTVALQNIGGIGNLTLLPRNGGPDQTLAFDTGPGNMVIDQIVERMTGGLRHYDEGGQMAARGRVDQGLLGLMLGDPWLSLPPPKSTGREAYGAAYVDEIMRKGRETGLADIDILATATRFTAECVALAIERFCPVRPDVLILGGGGARNRTLVCHIRDAVSAPVFRNEDLGYNSDAKEAIAFAILANECVHDSCNNLPSATGARHPVVMGKITL